MNKEAQISEFETLITDLSNEKIKDIYNSYAEANSCELIFNMCMLDEVLGELPPTKVLDSVAPNFKTNEKYFIETIYGLESFDNMCDCEYVDFTNLAKYVIEHEEFDQFDEDDLLEAFYNCVCTNEPNRSREDFEKANEMYYDFFGVFFDITDSWETLESDLIEIIDHDFEV